MVGHGLMSGAQPALNKARQEMKPEEAVVLWFHPMIFRLMRLDEAQPLLTKVYLWEGYLDL